MNTKIKILAGMLAGIVAGALLVGTAVAAPRMMTRPAFDSYGMMRSFDASGPTLAEMNSFMDQYRTAAGSIDVARMHADVTSGKITSPHMWGTPGSAPKSNGGRASYRRGSSMMRGYTPNGSSTGYNMMGSTY
jgi:hypothetical protein